MKSITVDGIDMSVERKQIKNMYIRILPPDGAVKITAPLSASDCTIRQFTESRIAWIKKQRQKVASHPSDSGHKYISGESISVWGQKYILDVLTERPVCSVEILGQHIVMRVPEGSTAQQRAGVLDEWYRQILKAAIPPLLSKCENVVGIKADEWHIKNMRTKWGTCNIQKKRVWLNLQLAGKSPDCLEYVIIHELTHLYERKHDSVFYRYMDSFCPNWRSVKAKLNEKTAD
jgi:predicted metal-dependent hydrolase